MVKNIPVGFPLGIKINLEDLSDELTLEHLVEQFKCYHQDKYVIGYDTLYVEKPHYHIHFLSAKDTSEGAIKVFRTALKKKYPHLPKSFRFYTGQDLPTANTQNWLAYCIKEKLIKANNIEVTDEMVIEAKSHLEVKRLKKIHSEKKVTEQKEKQDFKEKMFAYVLQHQPDYQSVGTPYYANEQKSFEVTCIKYLIENNKYGSIKKIFLGQYYLEYKTKYCSDKWDAEQVYNYLYLR